MVQRKTSDKKQICQEASPWCRGRTEQRRDLLRATADRVGTPVVYVNQVGGNDDLVFDGGSVIVDQRGEVVARARAFEEDFVFADLDPAGAGSR